MPKTNHKGRTNYTPYVYLHRGITKSEAWTALSPEARCLVLLVWERHNGTNIGEVSLSHREAREGDLQNLEQTERGSGCRNR